MSAGCRYSGILCPGHDGVSSCPYLRSKRADLRAKGFVGCDCPEATLDSGDAGLVGGELRDGGWSLHPAIRAVHALRGLLLSEQHPARERSVLWEDHQTAVPATHDPQTRDTGSESVPLLRDRGPRVLHLLPVTVLPEIGCEVRTHDPTPEPIVLLSLCLSHTLCLLSSSLDPNKSLVIPFKERLVIKALLSFPRIPCLEPRILLPIGLRVPHDESGVRGTRDSCPSA